MLWMWLLYFPLPISDPVAIQTELANKNIINLSTRKVMPVGACALVWLLSFRSLDKYVSPEEEGMHADPLINNINL